MTAMRLPSVRPHRRSFLLRTLRLLTFAWALILFSSPAMADYYTSAVNVMAEVDRDSIAVPGCGGAAAGTSFAATSVFCNLDSAFFSANASGQTGLGPYGIGVSMRADASGVTFTSPSYTAESSVSVSWSEDFVIEGARGDGFITFDLTRGGSGAAALDIGGSDISADLFGVSIPEVCECFELTEPVTFDTQYVFSMSGFLRCSAFDQIGCGSLSLDLSNIEFTDASKNVLRGVTLEPVGLETTPETSSWLLLATCAAPVIVWRRSRSKRSNQKAG